MKEILLNTALVVIGLSSIYFGNDIERYFADNPRTEVGNFRGNNPIRHPLPSNDLEWPRVYGIAVMQTGFEVEPKTDKSKIK